MDAAFAPEDEQFRQEVRTFLREATPEALRYKVENGIEMQREDVVGWHKILHKQGWVAPNWPEEHGGPGWSLTQKYIFDEELGLAGAPRLVTFGLNMCGPVLMAFGTEAQKARFLEAMLTGEARIGFGLTEPDHGSDATWLSTTARREGSEWVIDGTKRFNSGLHHATHDFVFARTSGEPGDAREIGRAHV